MGGELLSGPRAQARKLGWQALAGWGATGLLAVKGWWFVGLVGAGVAVWLTLRWFRHRATWGMRF
ncbi:MAG: hypothetical protein FJ100_14265 [Deltaproteobacteria bacterium]|nr:hypothetical protein [Deltaproteobacteria bacterium]